MVVQITMTLAVVGRHPEFLTPSLPAVFFQGVSGLGVGQLCLVLFHSATWGVCAALRLEGRCHRALATGHRCRPVTAACIFLQTLMPFGMFPSGPLCHLEHHNGLRGAF